MEFFLPTNLQNKLIAYDPVRKQELRQQKTNSPAKKSKYPLGNIPHLIPYSIVNQTLQQHAIDDINSNPAIDRFQEFTNVLQVRAILYHYESCWYAAWLPVNGEDYVYGFAYAFKDNPSTRKAIPRPIFDLIEKCEQVSVGRTTFFIYRKLVTVKEMQVGYTGHNWRAQYIGNYYKKARNIITSIGRFEESLKQTIPIWKDSREIFSRLSCNSIWRALDINCRLIPENKIDNWELTVDNLFEICKRRSDVYGMHSPRDSEYQLLLDHARIFDTPFFRRWIQSQLNCSTELYNDKNNSSIVEVRAGFKRIFRLADSIDYIQSIWPDCPIDYYRNHLDQLMAVRFRSVYFSSNKESLTIKWLQDHMPVSSFFKILDKYCKERLEKRYKSDYASDLGVPLFWFTDWNDTVSMLNRVLSAGKTIDPPRRWRLVELHDYIQAEAWKISNPNEDLPQDLFTEPVKVELDDQTWTFFQPRDTHQLASWGKAVRNCVGSASSYANGVRKKEHFIVLCMIDGQPQFTIQLIVRHGRMIVEQIRGVSNSILSDELRAKYENAFSNALQSC